jgi:hypothetical protein
MILNHPLYNPIFGLLLLYKSSLLISLFDNIYDVIEKESRLKMFVIISYYVGVWLTQT